MPERKTRKVAGKPNERRAAPKRAGSTAKPAAAASHSSQLKKA
jgi:hypothetical protein